MQKESYSLILNSQTSTNIINNTNLGSVSYDINWLNILPQKHKRYIVTFQCNTANSNTAYFIATQTTTVLTVVNMIHGKIFVGMQYFYGNIVSTVSSFVTTGGGGIGGTGTYNIINAVAIATNTAMYSMNSTFTNNVICSINFGSNNTIESNSASDKLGALYPTSYPVILSSTITLHTSNLLCTVPDNGPLEIVYPSNNNITVRFTNIDGTPITQMTNYNLQLYFTPIE
jgi:hypothetical protein